MRYTKIELEGRTGNFAVLSRKRDGASIEVEILKPGGTSKQRVHAADAEGLRAMAVKIQEALDGGEGAAADLDAYAGVLALFAD
jgi:hypothetical protein